MEDKLLKERQTPVGERDARPAPPMDVPLRPDPLPRRSRAHLLGAGVHMWPELLLLLGLCAIAFFYRLGEPSLWDNSEPEYAATALEMLRTGNWLTPHYNGQPVFVHPPLYYWLTALSFNWLGVNEFAARFSSALFAVGGVLLVMAIARRLFNPRIGVYAAFIQATFLGSMVIARLAFLDTALSFFVLLGFWFFLRASARPSPANWAGFWVSLGLAVLAKGPVGLVSPWLVLVPFILLLRRLDLLRNRWFWACGLLFLAVISPWFGLESAAYGLDFLRTNFGQFTVGRFLGVVMNQSGPWYYYLVTLVPLAFPWCVWIPAALHDLYRHRRETASLFVLLGIVVPLIFFSCAQTKMPWYIISVYPFLAMGIAKFFYDWEVVGSQERWLRWHGRLGFAALIGLVLAAHLALPGYVIDLGYPEAIRLVPWTAVALVGVLIAAWSARSSGGAGLTVCAATMVLLIALLAATIIPESEKYKRRGLALQVAALAAPTDRVGIVDSFGFTIPFYGRHRVDLICQDVSGIKDFLADRRYHSFYLLPLRMLPQVRAAGGPMRLLAMENDFALVVNR